MPYPENFVYLRALGHFGANASTAVERWSAGFKFRNPGAAPTPTNLTSFLESASVHLSTFHTSSSTLVGGNCWLDQLTAAYIGPDGKYVGGGSQSTTVYSYGTPPVGSGTTIAPYSTAIVTSLRTQVLRGPGSNGRVYWPATSSTIVQSTGVLTGAQVSAYASAAQTLANALNNSADGFLPGTGGLSVMSKVSSGVAASVTAIRVGQRIDRQERRENDIAEAYVSRAVTPIAAFVVDRSNVPIGRT